MLYVDFTPDIHIEEVKQALFHHRDQLAVCFIFVLFFPVLRKIVCFIFF